MKTSKDSNSKSSSCSGIVRRLLCAGCTTQTHSTVVPDHSEIQFITTTTTKSSDQDVVVKTTTSSNPGVVARLMGLETFPDPTTPGHTTLGALLRSRSVNSIDFLVHFDPGFLPHHRRVRTSISFTQVRLEDGGNDVKWQKRQKGDILQEKKGAAARKVEMMREVRNRSREKDFQSTRPQVKRQLDKNEMCVRRRRNKNRVHPRRRVRSKEPPVLSENGIFQGVCEKKKRTSKGDDERRSRMVEEICRATEEDVKEDWDPKIEDFEGEICREFGQEILHALMKQLIDELHSFY